MAEALQRLHRPGDRDVEAGDGVDHLRSPHEGRPGIGAGEILPRRFLRREGVGLVLKAADGDAGHVHALRKTMETGLPVAATGPCGERRPSAGSTRNATIESESSLAA